jgi:hypothetical protein
MSQALSTSILDRLLAPLGEKMSPEFARQVIEYRIDQAEQDRLDELADKCTDGALTDSERDEYERYVQAIHVIGILQRKAKRVLANGTHV